MRLELKAIKIQGNLLKIGQSFLFITILFVLYLQLAKFNWKDYTWTWPKNTFALMLAIILVGLNWFFEWRKWTFMAEKIGINSRETIQRGFFAGMLSGFLTPSALGNFLGRMSVVQKDVRPKVVSYTLFGNWASFNVSLLFGFASLFLVDNFSGWIDFRKVEWIVGAISTSALLLYFSIDRFPFFSRLFRRFTPSFSAISLVNRMHLLSLSILRYLVFSFQFYLLIYAFQPEIDFTVYFWIWNVYLWSTLSPSLLMGKLFIRETLAVFILTKAGIELPVALLASLSVWTLNNALPSIYAYFKWKQYGAVQD